MIIFPGDYVKTKSDGLWHKVKETDGNMLIQLDNGFFTYATEACVEEYLSADEYTAQIAGDLA